MSIESVKAKSENAATFISASSSNQEQLTNSDKKNTLHVRSEISAVPCKKAKLLRIERKQNKLLAQGKSQTEIESIMKEKKQQNYVKSLEELFEEVNTGLKKLEVILYQQLNSKIIVFFLIKCLLDVS